MSELNNIQIGDWLMIASTIKGSSYLLQQVTSTTSGLVRTLNYTFRRDGRSFSVKQKSVTARLAQSHEIERWLSSRKKQETQQRMEPTEDLARHLASVSAEEWARLGVAQLKKIRAALEKS
ncbi:hypothetical protein H7849_20415 [Alloacidobacterium dinghuense]|uniref:Uncharacterized protein n=1 Tax=Alloacidobacterium dinghuense TaxID=2763107 RepID=A0A7G8BFU6_9BACT|nr:hypothetical protein [Alloacidobacterium dinghuense]QNI31416.1 hypothetical protein H7849_20415 [Alloacidobacterium dinghuense]